MTDVVKLKRDRSPEQQALANFREKSKARVDDCRARQRQAIAKVSFKTKRLCLIAKDVNKFRDGEHVEPYPVGHVEALVNRVTELENKNNELLSVARASFKEIHVSLRAHQHFAVMVREIIGDDAIIEIKNAYDNKYRLWSVNDLAIKMLKECNQDVP